MNRANILALILALTVGGQAATTPVDRRDYTPAGAAFNVATADFNGDGIMDILSTGNNSPGSVSVLLGNGDGTFQAQPVVSPEGTYYPSAVAVGDFNHDGKVDVVAAIETNGGFGVE